MPPRVSKESLSFTSASLEDSLSSSLSDNSSLGEISLEDDSFEKNTSKKFQQLTQVCNSHKNRLADVSAALSSNSSTLLKHSTKLIGNSTKIMSAASAAVPIGTVVGSGINFVKDCYTEGIVTERLLNIQILFKRLLQEHFPEGLTYLKHETELYHLHTNHVQHEISALETLAHTFHFAIQKTEKRIQRLQIQQKGSEIAIFGAGVAAAGSAIAGVGAIPGIVISTAGGVVNLAPTFEAMGRAGYKKINHTKGLARKSSAQMIWGFSLNKLLTEKIITREDFRDCSEAVQAHCYATEWQYSRAAEDLLRVQNIAYEFLEKVGIIKDKALPENFLTVEGLKKIEARFKSTASV